VLGSPYLEDRLVMPEYGVSFKTESSRRKTACKGKFRDCRHAITINAAWVELVATKR
jgi:hypothetical protein